MRIVNPQQILSKATSKFTLIRKLKFFQILLSAVVVELKNVLDKQKIICNPIKALCLSGVSL